MNNSSENQLKTIKKSIISNIELWLTAVPFIIAIINVIISGILTMIDPEVYKNAIGMFSIFVIPVGILLSIPLVFLPCIAYINYRKPSLLYFILKLVLCPLTFFSFKKVIKDFTINRSYNDIFIIVVIIVVCLVALLSIINYILYLVKKNK